MRISPEGGSEISLRISPPAQSSQIDEWFDIEAFELGAKAGVESGAKARAELGEESRDLVIEKAQKSTQKARAKMVLKYSKRYDIQHFEIGDIVSIKVPREDRTSTDNRRLFGRVLNEPYPHRYKVLTSVGIIKRLIPTKGLGVVNKALWLDILILDSEKEVTLGMAAREASTSARVGISC